MKKFHVSTDGNVRKCDATKQKCKLDHFGTIAEAQAAYEQKMSKDNMFPSVKLDKTLRNHADYKKYSTFGKTFKNVSGSLNDVKNNAVKALNAFARGGYIPKNTKIASLSKSDENTVEAHLTGLDDKSIEKFVNTPRKMRKTSKSLSVTRKGVLAVASLAMVSGLAACGEVSEGNRNDDGAYVPSDAGVEETLNSADEIQLKKDMISFGDHWTVYADGEHVADIDGEVIPTFGDTYVMTDLNGDMVGFETENFLTLNRGAETYDANSQNTGRIEQSILSIGYNFKIYDGDTQVGTTQQNLSLGLSAKVKDMQGTPEYKIDKALVSLGSSVSVVPLEGEEDRQVDAVDAVWNAVIMSEIDEAENNEN